MAYYDDYETGFRGYYSDVDLDGDGIYDAPSAGAYDVRGKCSKSDNECLWACPQPGCNRLYSAKRNGEAHDMTGTCYCGAPINR